ncbi:MAG: NUDIX domain-containing protein [Candidatus ainarchaeum sp.]|nr:NUDIX domain-containing protein [Candidatus ainarchaeum sp.]
MQYNVIVVVGIVENNGQILIGKKAPTPGHRLDGAWHIPGGRLHKDETEELALIREIREEAGLDIIVKDFIDEIIFENGKVLIRWYHCSSENCNPIPGDDLVEAKFVPKSDILKVLDQRAISSFPPKVLEYFLLL